MLQAALGILSVDFAIPGPAVWLRPLALFLVQRKPKNFLLCECSLFEMFHSHAEPHLGEQMYSQSQALRVDFMIHRSRLNIPVISSLPLVGEFHNQSLL